jgi:hypothetical protein
MAGCIWQGEQGSRGKTMTEPKLALTHPALTAITKRLLKVVTLRRAKSARLGLSYQDGHLRFEMAGAEDAVSAVGEWKGTVRVPGTVLLMLAKGEPPCDWVELSYADGKLHIRGGGAHVMFRGQWEDISPPNLDMPLDASDRDYLRLSLRNFSAAQIAASGLEKQVAACESRFQKAIDRAVPIFAKYKISRADLEAAVRALVTKVE